MRLCPWPWPREGLSLASKFFCVLGIGLEPCVLNSTSENRTSYYLFRTIAYRRIKQVLGQGLQDALPPRNNDDTDILKVL